MKLSPARLSLLVGAGLMLSTSATAQTSVSPTSPTAQPPRFSAPSDRTGAKPAADMQAVLDAHARLGPKPIETLSPAEARVQPSPADAVKAVMQARGMSTAPDASVTTREIAYASDPMQKVRVYTPAGPAPRGGRPLVVYYHGGGWVIADLDTYDATPRVLAQQLGAVVVSVEYRHAPEAKFPAQHQDAAAAYRWVLNNGATLGGDTRRVALAGESAGGNLAVATAIYARDNKLPAPRHILAVYPIANSGKTLPSRTDSAKAKPLNTSMLSWFSHYFSRTPSTPRDPRINLVAANLRGLAPVTIVNAQIDPLRSDGETLAAALRKAGVRVQQRTFSGVTHEFFGMGKVVRGALEAENYAVSQMRPSLQRAGRR